ncbi:MAG: hypothetical protein IKO19_05460 [Candidatus Riflebacteria bacterium]|nr:hypothetical protein [Candidatus Riflebacteria bacterium]
MSDLKKFLKDTYDMEIQNIEQFQFKVHNLRFEKIRDYLIMHGNILSEDLNEKIYIAIVYGGIAHKNPAYLAIQLTECIIINISAKEGLFDQHTIEGVINEFKAEFKDYIEE